MIYELKTRNWNGKKWVFKLLSLSKFLGVHFAQYDDGNGYIDYDVKFWCETVNPFKAWSIWAYFMCLRPFSGGWTYIVRPGSGSPGPDYKSIY